MELPIGTEDIELSVLEVSGTVTDRRTGESELTKFYRPSGNTVIVTLIQTLDKLGYDFRQLPDSVRIHEVKIPVKDLIPEEEPAEDDGQEGEPVIPPDPIDNTDNGDSGDGDGTGNDDTSGDGDPSDGENGDNSDDKPTDDSKPDDDGQSDSDDDKNKDLMR